jgi:molybdopterin converting factor small subunit
LRTAGVGIEEVRLYFARLKEFLRSDAIFAEAKEELEKIRELYEKGSEKSQGATEALTRFIKDELRVLDRLLSQVEEGVEREGSRKEGDLPSATLPWREALEDLERELRLLDALNPRHDSKSEVLGGRRGAKSGDALLMDKRRERNEAFSGREDSGLSVEELLERVSKLKERLGPKDPRGLN